MKQSEKKEREKYSKKGSNALKIASFWVINDKKSYTIRSYVRWGKMDRKVNVLNVRIPILEFFFFILLDASVILTHSSCLPSHPPPSKPLHVESIGLTFTVLPRNYRKSVL